MSTSQPAAASAPRPKVFGNLLAEVVRKDSCTGCGSCAATCPVFAIQMEEGKPKLAGVCLACQVCYNSCPVASLDLPQVEAKALGRARTAEEPIGVYKAIYTVRAKSPDVLSKCQDGGAVTTLLQQFFDDGGDGAVITGAEEGKPWSPKPLVITSKQEVLAGAGTKYTPSPTMLGVASAVKDYHLSRLAVVGTPCQIRAMRKIESSEKTNVKIRDAIKMRIGLFCTESFSYAALMEFLAGKGVKPTDVTKFQIKSGKFTATRGSEVVYEAKVTELNSLVRPCCHTCADFSAELADISVGSVGSAEGWSTVIVRTEAGETLLKDAEKAGLLDVKPIEEGKAGAGAVRRLSEFKRKRGTTEKVETASTPVQGN